MAICTNCECPSERHGDDGRCEECCNKRLLNEHSRRCVGYSQEPGGSHSNICTHLRGHKPWCYGVVKNENGMWILRRPPDHIEHRRQSSVVTGTPIMLGRIIDCD